MRRALGLLYLLPLALILSCSDLPTVPRAGSVTVSGRITDRDGPPLEGVYVRLQLETPVSGVPFYHSIQTDADGRYTLKVPEGIYRVQLEPYYAGGYPAVEMRNVKIGPSGATIDHRYTGVRVSGSIVGLNSSPLSGASIGVSGTSGGQYVSASDQSIGGHYSLLIPAGLYEVFAQSESYDNGLPRIRSGQVPVLSDTTIDFALTGFAVRVTASLPAGAPMIGGFVSASSGLVDAAVRTGLDGAGTLYLPAGNYAIRAHPPTPSIVGPQTVTRLIQADDTVDFAFSGVRWDLTIRRASDGSPLDGVSATVHDTGRNEQASATTNPFGTASCLVRPGTIYDLTIFSWEGGYYEANFYNLSSAADTTFEFSVSTPFP